MFENEKVIQAIAIVVATEQSVEFFTFIFQGFHLNLNHFLRLMNVFMKNFRTMTFRRVLGEHLMMASSTNMFYIANDYKKKTNIKVAASDINIKIH